MTSSGETILDVLSSDHRAVLKLLDQLDAGGSGAPANSVELAGSADSAGPAGEGARERLVIELVRHFVAEEQYLYPLVRERLPDGPELADAGFASNRSCEQALKALEDPRAGADHLAVSLATIRRLVASHLSEQEQRLFPALEQQARPAELAQLAEQVLGAEQLAPTRPRAVAAANPALNKFSSIVEGFIDHVRDSYSHRGVQPDDLN